MVRRTPKRQATGSNPAGGAKSTAASHFLLVCSVFCFASPGLLLVWDRENFMRCNVYPAKKKRTISMFLLRKIPSLLIGVFGLTCRPVPPRAAQPMPTALPPVKQHRRARQGKHQNRMREQHPRSGTRQTSQAGGVVHFSKISADQSLIRWPFHPIRWI